MIWNKAAVLPKISCRTCSKRFNMSQMKASWGILRKLFNYLIVVTSSSDIDDCVNVTCQNSGSCIDGINNFTCSCQKGYTGDLCETGNKYSCHSKKLYGRYPSDVSFMPTREPLAGETEFFFL